MSSNATDKKEKILIIEGNGALGESISNRLRHDGYTVFLVKDGVEALKSIYDSMPQLIIMDLVVQGMDAYDVLAKKQADAKLNAIGTFLLSTQGVPINMHLVPENSIVDFIVTLNVDLEDIATRVNKYFGHTPQKLTPVETVKQKKVLWVEDDKLIGSILEKKFISSGFDLFHAKNGDEALSYLKNTKPDAIVLDLMLPGMDGFEILQKTRMDQQLKNVPVMILSNLSKPSDLEKAKILGASKFMVKASSSLDQIVTAVQSLAA